MDADAPFHAAVAGDRGIPLRRQVLQGQGAFHGADYRGELDQDAVARRLKDPSAMLRDERIGSDPMLTHRLHRARFVDPHQPAVADDIGRKDRGETAGRSHGCGRPPLGEDRAPRVYHNSRGATGAPASSSARVCDARQVVRSRTLADVRPRRRAFCNDFDSRGEAQAETHIFVRRRVTGKIEAVCLNRPFPHQDALTTYIHSRDLHDFQMPSAPSRLCGATQKLQESHILPGLVFRWMKETSATGYLRCGRQPNLRVQDGLKLHLLCAGCEQRFNEWETQFAKQIFHPMTQGKAESACYASWLLLFCASVSWRVLVYFMDGKHLDHVPAALRPSVEHAEVTWREFLLGNRPRPQPHEQHILPLALGALESYTQSEMPTNINRYLFRYPDMEVASDERDAFTYAKLGPFIILGFIAMPRPKQWVGTMVNVQGGTLGLRQCMMPRQFWDFISGRADRAATLKEQISDRQTAKIAETYKANLVRTAQSDTMRVMRQDVQLFGGRAFTRK